MNRTARVRDDSGASAVEYGLIAVAVAAVVTVAVLALGTLTGSLMDTPCESVQASGTTTADC